MSIVERLQQEAKRHPGSTGEGVRIALEVLQECNCGTCRHSLEYSAQFGQISCEHPPVRSVGGVGPLHNNFHFCSHWEARQ